MSINMFLGEADHQAENIATQCRNYQEGLEQVKTAIAQFILEDTLQGKTYDSAKQYLNATFVPLANGIILICEALEKAAKQFPKSYRTSVDHISLQEDVLRRQLNRLDSIIQTTEKLENALKVTPVSPLLRQFSETLEDSKREIKKQLDKLLAFDPISGQLFADVESLLGAVEQGLKEVHSGKGFQASTGTFSTMGLNMAWVESINQKWQQHEEKQAEKERDTIEIKELKSPTGSYFQVLRNGKVDQELSEAYQKAVMTKDLKSLLHFGGEFALVNDIYRLVNGKDWLSGKIESRTEAAGWLALTLIPLSKLTQIAKELKAGNRALKGVALSEKDLEALKRVGILTNGAKSTGKVGGYGLSKLDNKLIDKLKKAGVKITKGDVIKIKELSNDKKIVWLEKGNSSAGFEHILIEHGEQFVKQGISKVELPDFLMSALEKGKVIGYQGRGKGRPIYEVIYNGEMRRVAITVGKNGFIVGANPVSIK
ncbi:T7SS effector LXG polymorphic toxin [Listeria aquatica]|uniref:T7SS effector LXG polymorphic toxin n=1 Tax=Listeria aquatica TaxID=1494960 RepID=UPI0031F5717C